MRAGEWFALSTLGAILLGTFLRLVPRWTLPISRFDIFMLLPEWKFFAPKPGRGDHHLLFRDSQDGTAWTPWSEIGLITPRRWHHFIWNPKRREKKALLDFVAALVSRMATGNSEGLEISIAYLALLGYVIEVPSRSVRPRFTQFLLLNRDGVAAQDAFEPMFVSEPHPVDAP